MRELLPQTISISLDEYLQLQSAVRVAEQRTRQLELLNRVGALISAARNLREILQVVLSEGLRAAGADEGSVMLINRSTLELEFQAWIVQGEFVDDKLHRRLRVGEGIAGNVVATGIPYNCQDTRSDPFFVTSFTGRSPRSLLSIPIVATESVLGVISADHAEPHFFHDEHVELLQSLARQAAIAITKERLLNRAERMNEQLLALHKITQQIKAELDIQSLLNLIAQHATELLKADSGGILLLDQQRAHLTFHGSHKLGPEIISGTRDLVGTSIAGRVVQTGRAIIANDIPKDSRFYNPSAHMEKILAIVSTPLSVRGEIIGTLDVHSKTEGHAFTEDDLEILALLANHAAIAIENARLVAGTVERSRRLELLAQASREIMANLGGLSLDERLQMIARHAAEILRSETCGILLVRRPGVLSLEASYGHRAGHFQKGKEFQIASGPSTGLTGHIAFEGKLFNAFGKELTNHPAAKGEPPHTASGRWHSLLAIPLTLLMENEERLIGLLRADNKKDRDGASSAQVGFTTEDAWILQLFAGIAVAAIEAAGLVNQLSAAIRERIQLHDQTDRRRQLLAALEEKLRHIRATSEPIKLLYGAVRLAAELTGCPIAGIAINRPHLQDLELIHAQGLPDDLLGRHELHGEGVIGLVASTGSSQVAADMNDRANQPTILTGVAVEQLMCVPLKDSGEVAAVLFVADIMGECTLGQIELEILERFAVHVSQTYQIALLMGRDQRMFSQLKMLHHISDYIQEAVDLDKILHVALTSITAGYSLGFNCAALLLLDKRQEYLVGRMGIGHLSQDAAKQDWEEHHQRGLEDFRRYLDLLEAHGLPPATPIDTRIRELSLWRCSPAAESFWGLTAEHHYVLNQERDLKRLPAAFIAAFEPSLPLVIAPLVAHNQVIGFVVADNRFTYAPITPDDVEALLTFTNTIALAIINRHLFQETDAARRQFGSFSKASSLLVSSRDPARVLNDTVEQARIAAQADGVSAILIDDDSELGHAHSLATAGIDVPIDRAGVAIRPDGHSISVLRSGVPAIIEDMHQHNTANPAMSQRNVTAAFCLPISIEGQRIGVMWFHYYNPRRFSDAEIDAAQLYVNQAAIAYDSARRIKNLQDVRNAARAVAEVTVLEDLELTLDSIVKCTLSTLNCDAVVLFVYDQAQDILLHPPHMVNVNHPERAKQVPDIPRTSIVFKMLQQDQIYRVEDVLIDPLFKNTRFSRDEGVKSCVAIPLSVRGERVGVMFINYRRRYRITDDECTNIELFANQAAVAIQNARRYEDLKRIKGIIGRQTAIDWIRMVSTAWWHDIQREVGIARGRVLLTHDGIAAGRPPVTLQDELAQLDATLKGIKDILIIEPLSQEDAIAPISVNELLKTFLELSRQREQYRNIDIHIALTEDLDQRVSVRASRAWLQRAIEILADNAVHAMQNIYTSRKELSIISRVVESQVEIVIRDTGPGIPTSLQRRIFRERIRKASDEPGSGIGLLLASTIVQTYGGDICINPAYTDGAEFLIRLPAEQLLS